MSTAYHAKYFAHELTKRCPSDSVGKLAASLADAQVDLNPHQIDAALFAFRSPLSKGALLADEVGLGKTIEAGILLSQKWAERRRQLLVIVPANLRKQWSQELADKFFLPSVILEARSFNEAIKKRNLNPFTQPSIVICSYQFARGKEPYVAQIDWDLVIVDEAHRLRNVYKPSNKIANAIKKAIARAPKVLLTATPLQNSLLELFGLISIIDEYAFGDLKSFKAQFSRLTGDDQFADLKERLRPVCQRTLRRQVLEYVKYTNRIPITQEFFPSEAEQRLYDLVSDYLQRPNLYALPSSQRKLMTLILRKLLASSTYAISSTLQGLSSRLAESAKQAEAVQTPPEEVAADFETLEEVEDEWKNDDEAENEDADSDVATVFTTEQIGEMKQEVETLREFSSLAKSIVKNSKGEVLLTALNRGFEEARKRGSGEKAIIFTESRRTQEYLRDILEGTDFAGKLVLFNGTNTDPQSKAIYERWLAKHAGTDRVSGSPSADKRAALVDYFREEAVIMIATEAAAEGINLQFCSLVVNYDLPWNPQRIEQRIGRCHRYGQKYDVVVVNFLNKKNAADQRVYQLLDQKFKLFSGVFGASDEVLGAIESGVDFEKRIVDIYQKCRTEEQIEFEFDALQHDMEEQIDDRMRQTRQKLLENFDEEVHEKLRVSLKESSEYLDRYESWLWQLTRYFLAPYADFEEGRHGFVLRQNPFPEEHIHPGPYRSGGVGRSVEDANLYRVGHPLAQRVITRCRDFELDRKTLTFRYTGAGKRIFVLDELAGKEGWLMGELLTVSAFESEDHILLAGRTDSGAVMTDEQCRRLFSLNAEEELCPALPASLAERLNESIAMEKQGIIARLESRNGGFFEAELDKLDRWGEDRRATLKTRLRELEDAIKVIKRAARLAPNLPLKLKLERERRDIEANRDEAWKEYEEAARDIEKRKDALIDEVEKKLSRHLSQKTLFTIRWRVV
ncbi:MAG: DEAD/DEAH box helicase family protein [Blastocatellia bacterium]|nr:DEAD/DEAH box helicase family protein [Blastocatellia bacterium]